MPHVSCLRQSAEFGIKLPSCSLGDLLLQYLVSLLSPVGMLFDILSSLAVESICYACLMIDRRTQDAFQLCRLCVLTAIPAKTEAGGFEKVVLVGERPSGIGLLWSCAAGKHEQRCVRIGRQCINILPVLISGFYR